MDGNMTTPDVMMEVTSVDDIIAVAGAFAARINDEAYEDGVLIQMGDEIIDEMHRGEDPYAAARRIDGEELQLAFALVAIAEAGLEPGEKLSGCAMSNAVWRIDQARSRHIASR